MYEDDGSVFWRNIEWEHEIYEISLEEVEEKQMKKNEKNGGFSKRLYIDHVGIDKSSKWFDYYANNLKKYPVVEK